MSLFLGRELILKQDTANEYRREKLIVKKKFCRIFKCSKGDKHYCLKEMLIRDERNLKMYEKEIKILKHISKIPNLNDGCVKYHDDFIYKDPLYSEGYMGVIVLEYIEGVNLKQFKNKLKKDSNIILKEDIKEIGLWLFNILSCLHKNGIIHKDIKPENIMYDMKNGRYVLIDFGLSNFCTVGDYFTMEGTGYYLSPEVYKKVSDCMNTKIVFDDLLVLKFGDIWAGLITIYYLLELRVPYPKTDTDVMFFDKLYKREYFYTLQYPCDKIKKYMEDILNSKRIIRSRSIISFFSTL